MSQTPFETSLHNPGFISETDLGRRWGKSLRTLQRYRAQCTGPAYFKIGHTVFYRPEDIAAFEDGARQSPGPARD